MSPLKKADFEFGQFARDFDKSPYDGGEKRVANWLNEVAGVGGGDDPVGFLLSSYVYLVSERKELKRELAALKIDNDRLYALTMDKGKEVVSDPGEDLYQAEQAFIASITKKLGED